MTAPVRRRRRPAATVPLFPGTRAPRAAPAASSQKLPAAAPPPQVRTRVNASAGPFCKSSYTVSFMLPRAFQRHPPRPNNPDVYIEREHAGFTAFVAQARGAAAVRRGAGAAGLLGRPHDMGHPRGMGHSLACPRCAATAAAVRRRAGSSWMIGACKAWSRGSARRWMPRACPTTQRPSLLQVGLGVACFEWSAGAAARQLLPAVQAAQPYWPAHPVPRRLRPALQAHGAAPGGLAGGQGGGARSCAGVRRLSMNPLTSSFQDHLTQLLSF